MEQRGETLFALYPGKNKMKQKKNITKTAIMVVAVISFLAVCYGQDSQAKQPAVEDIFQDIMLTLPSDVKADMDSVKTNKPAVPVNSNEQVKNNNEKIQEQMQKDKRLQELPENVRNQVEKAIIEIDRNREERVLEFKEMKKKKEK